MEAQLCVCTAGCFCLSLLCLWRRGQRNGWVGDRGNGWGSPLCLSCACFLCLFPLPVPSLLHIVLWGCCLLKGTHLLHRSSFWFLISAAHLQELLWSEVSSRDYYPRCAPGWPCSSREVEPADPRWSLPAWPLLWFCDMWTLLIENNMLVNSFNDMIRTGSFY